MKYKFFLEKGLPKLSFRISFYFLVIFTYHGEAKFYHSRAKKFFEVGKKLVINQLKDNFVITNEKKIEFESNYISNSSIESYFKEHALDQKIKMQKRLGSAQ